MVIWDTDNKLKLSEGTTRTKSKLRWFREREHLLITVARMPLTVETTRFSEGFKVEIEASNDMWFVDPKLIIHVQDPICAKEVLKDLYGNIRRGM